MHIQAYHPQSAVRFHQDHYEITLFVAPEYQVQSLALRYEPDHEETLLEMTPATSSHPWPCYRVRMPCVLHSAQQLYCFKLICQNRQVYVHAAGTSAFLPQKHMQFRLAKETPPAWVKDQIFYQIFPERFARGNSEALDLSHYPYHTTNPLVQKQWDEVLEPEPNKNAASTFYGGDLLGIIDKLDYLQRLGVSALYLNPIFCSPSNHKYDTTDYYHVDPQFGGNEALVKLRAALDARKMRLMLDAVVNHTSNQHPWFDRYQAHENGAYAKPDSPYRDYYHFLDEKHYWAWKGCNTLPKLNFANKAVQAHIYDDDDAILRFWLRPPYNIDGWRFDVIHMLGEHNSAQNNAHYVKAFRHAIKQTKSDAYMIGEHFSEASQWLQGDQEDGAMNYFGFTQPITAFLTGIDIPRHAPICIDAATLVDCLKTRAAIIPFENQLAQYNLLDSHDTPRFLNIAKGNKATLKLALSIMACYVGVPSIYYGDEIGLAGGHDPDCRRCFPWNENTWDHELLEHYRAYLHLRQQRRELRRGDIIHLYAQNDVWVFARHYENAQSIVAINRGQACQISLNLGALSASTTTHYVDAFNHETLSCDNNTLSLTLNAHRARVWIKSR